MSIAGFVLTGGASRRMGRTKALIEVDGRSMASRVVDALSASGCDPVVLIGGDPDELAPLGTVVVADDHPGEGPLGGVITALRSLAEGTAAALILPCDIPHIDSTVLDSLLRTARSLIDEGRAVGSLDGASGPGSGAGCSASVDVVVARTDRTEPMCAVWFTRALPALEAAFSGGERAMHRALAVLTTIEVDVPPRPLHNVNQPADLL